MKIFLIMVLSFIGLISKPTYKIDFGSEKDGQNWRIINDGVMGGLSKGKVEFSESSLRFNGTVSLANNGGFTSFKSPFQSTDLSAFKKVKIRARGEGQRIALTFETSRTWYYPYFKKNLPALTEEWQVFELSLAEFDQYRIGRKLDVQMDTEVQSQIIRIGFTTNDKKEGPFQFEIDYMEFE